MTEEKYIRPTWDEYFMEIAKTVATRSTCDRGRGGCVVVKDKQILVTGYVGSPPGQPHCDDVGHQMKTVTHDDGKVSQHCMRTIHMEQNAICQAAKRGVALDGATIYEKYTSCPTCAKLLVAVGIKKAVYAKRYHVYEETEKLFHDAGIEIVYFDDSIEPYANQ